MNAMANDKRKISLASPNDEYFGQPPKKKRRNQRNADNCSDSSTTKHDDVIPENPGSTAQLVPASPCLCDLTESLSESFHSPAVKKETTSSLSTLHTPHTSTPHTISTPMPPAHTTVVTSRAAKPLHSQTVKRSLDLELSKVVHKRVLDEEWLRRVSSPRYQQECMKSCLPYTAPTLSVSALLGQKAIILPEHPGGQISPQSSERPNFNHISITHFSPREE